MNTHRLTIGFPTYMRRDAIVARLKVLIVDPLIKDIPLLVIDNGSTDGTYDAIQTECSSPNLTLLRNDTNIGIVRNLTRLFRESRTDYLLLMSDEDTLNTTHLSGLLDLLNEKNPLFVSPQFLVNGSLYRGESNQHPIDPSCFISSSFYISGLVYHQQTAKYVDELEKLESTSAAARIYPLSVLVLNLMLHGSAYWYAQPLAEQAQQLPTLISDTNGNAYYYLPSRWRQHLDFQRYMDEYETRGITKEQSTVLASMRKGLDHSLFKRVINAIQSECPRSAQAFHQIASIHYKEAGLSEQDRQNETKRVEEHARLVELTKQLTQTAENQDRMLKEMSTEINRLLGLISQKDAQESETRRANQEEITRLKSDIEKQKNKRWLSRIGKFFKRAKATT